MQKLPCSQVLLRVKRLCDFGGEMAQRRDTPIWHDAGTGIYTYSMDGVVSEDKNKHKENGSVSNIEFTILQREVRLMNWSFDVSDASFEGVIYDFGKKTRRMNGREHV